MLEKILLKNRLSPGDTLMMTAAVRDLHDSHPGSYLTAVETTNPAVWENNPRISQFGEGEADRVIECGYSESIARSNVLPYHFIHGFRKDLERQLGVRIEQGAFKGEVYYSPREKHGGELLQKFRLDRPFWVLVAGGKLDFTAKFWNPDYFQEVARHFCGRVNFVQCGASGDYHMPVLGGNVLNLVGKTSQREFIALMYHALGVVCPVTFAMHLAAAAESKYGVPNRPCVVVAGGREPAHWEAYPTHRFLSNNGALPCNAMGGCWRSRCTIVGDGDSKDMTPPCDNYVETGRNIEVLDTVTTGVQPPPRQLPLRVPKCMDMIRPRHVIEAIESYYEGGLIDVS